MKNLNFFPFERNRYFYGKLLSVEDFETEQRYMNDKRRMLNRFLYGSGVICGMQVIEVDEVTISLEMGVALDFSGREIVVEAPVTKRLSAIEGFSGYTALEGDRRDLYLCIAYDEQAKEPAHNITRTEHVQEEEFNKYAEGYRLFITGEEPEQTGNQITALYESTQTVYEGNGIRIQQSVPKYIQSDSLEYITVVIEKGEQWKMLSFSYQVRLSCLEQAGNDVLTISFDEKNYEPAKRYELKVPVRAKAVQNEEGYMENVPESFMLKLGEDIRNDCVRGNFSVYVTADKVSQTIIHNYYQTAMEDMVKNNYEQPIYLAKIEVIRAGEAYVIERLENQPYKQYVWNNVLSETLEAMRLYKSPMESQKQCTSVLGTSKEQSPAGFGSMQVQTGSTWIDMGIGGIPGQCFFSKDIVHGLGLGEVSVTLGLLPDINGEGQGIFGNMDVFTNAKCPKVELAAKADFTNGKIVIGVKCLEAVEQRQIRVSWMVVKNADAQGKDEKMELLTILPDILNLQVRESHYFEAKLGDKVQRRISWSVKEAEGGTIDADGCYTAPNQAGVYEIIAESIEDKNLKAAAFVIVRDAV